MPRFLAWLFRPSERDRIALLEASVREVRDDMLAWEARAAKLTRELSRTLKAMAEVERRAEARERAKREERPEDEWPVLDLDEEEDLVTRTLRIRDGR